jgi:hypothetical protein
MGGANATKVINMITNTAPHYATLVICAGHKIIIIHHFKHDFNMPVTLDGMDKLWALLGNGSHHGIAGSSQHVISPWFLFCDSHLQSYEESP